MSGPQTAKARRHGRRFLFNIGGTIDRGAEGADVERRRRERELRRRRRRGGRVWGGGFPSPSPLGEGAVPPPQKIFRLRISKW